MYENVFDFKMGLFLYDFCVVWVVINFIEGVMYDEFEMDDRF